jgi:hypothetical protein
MSKLLLTGVVGLTVSCLGCNKKAGFPGYDSPPLADLVAEAAALGPPGPGAKPYVRPTPIQVPPLVRPDLSKLPKDDQGRSMVGELLGVRLIVEPGLRDPITAHRPFRGRRSAGGLAH